MGAPVTVRAVRSGTSAPSRLLLAVDEEDLGRQDVVPGLQPEPGLGH